jgi:hypothetical protein
MRRDEIDFDTFKKNFIDQPDGYFPVYAAFKENDDGDLEKVVQIDMICEWRLTDGKVQFFEVPFETEEQFNQIMGYLGVAADLLNKAVLGHFAKLKLVEGEPKHVR